VITLDLSTASIIYEGVRRVEDWTRIKTEMPEEDTVFIISSDPRSLFQTVELSEEDRTILSLLNGERTMEQVIEESGLKSFDALKSLYILWTIGMITDQFGQDMVALTLEEILKPVDDSREEFIARVESIHSALGSLSHHQLLAVDQYADIEQINRQYFKLTKEFHPDRYGDSLGPEVTEKITGIFDAITYAFESLKSSETDRQFTEGDLVLADEMLKSARAEIRDGDYLRAAEFLEEAVKSDPENPECWNYLSLALSRLEGRFTEAEKAMLRARKLEPENDEYIANLGLLYLRAGRTADARAQFEKALGLNPVNAKARKGLSKIAPE
jgi:tetratricopeptide (TPR) repeat protein